MKLWEEQLRSRDTGRCISRAEYNDKGIEIKKKSKASEWMVRQIFRDLGAFRHTALEFIRLGSGQLQGRKVKGHHDAAGPSGRNQEFRVVYHRRSMSNGCCLVYSDCKKTSIEFVVLL